MVNNIKFLAADIVQLDLGKQLSFFVLQYSE